MLRRNREINIFSLSAIDLFCSGMGAVMVLMVLLMPYYRKQTPAPPVPAPPPPEVVVQPPPPEKAVRFRGIDVVFVMDATGSMDDVIDSVRSGMVTMIQVIRRLAEDVNVGFIAYIDRDVPWVIRLDDVGRSPAGESNVRRLLAGIAQVRTVGNEDWPEDVYGGLRAAAAMDWPRGTERRQLIIVIGDARTHPEHHRQSLALVRDWAGADPQCRSLHAVFTLNPRLASHPEFSTEKAASSRYFKEIAEAGNGAYHEGQQDVLGDILDILIIH